YDGYTVTLDSGETLISRTVIWAAGVSGALFKGLRPESILKGNRLQVDEYNRVAGYQNVFALGDVAAMLSEAYPEGHPMMAQPAMQQGKLLGKNLVRLLAGKPMERFRYNDKGAMATIGRNHAVADLKILNKEYRTQGFRAWLIWTFIHLISIVGFRNRFLVFLNWSWNYFSYNSSIRLIVGKKQENVPVEAVTAKTEVGIGPQDRR
ncbi:MAG: FAD-dependent oxidoreductase, partial [Cytophagales bacterium]|nr:FAD-dependent oxidoreductase [Cytophagales bacterium]